MYQATEDGTIRAENLGGPSNLDKCAQEPIHIIGHIQPHGMLFALSEPDLIVRQVSANVSALLGMSPEALLDRTFEAVLGAQQFAQFQSLTLSPEALAKNPLPFRLAGGALSVLCVAHRQGGVLIVELELKEGAYSFEPLSLNAHIRLPLSRLELASDISELAELATREIQRLSGFDRVMVYRFDEKWNGEVIAESAVPSPVSYLGLRFPATDIPTQARQLFLQNPVRAIADVDATPVPIVPATGPLTGQPLDLTFSFLRSPASVHLEYLRNMGVQSSLTVSILSRQQLWGLIACHRGARHHVDYSTRSVCELIGQALGSQIALRTDNAALELQLAFRSLLDNYLAQIDAPASLVFGDCFLKQVLLDLFSADGLVLSLGGTVSVHGHSLEPAFLPPVIDRLRELSSNGIASSNMLSALDPRVVLDGSEVTGGLYLGLGGEAGDYLLLLRRSLMTTVTWAGNPDKSVNTDDQGKLHPRASFQAWQETVRAGSRPWSELELEGARALRVKLLERQASFESAWSRQRFRFLADSMPQLIWTAKPDGSVDYYNQRWIDYTGISMQQSISWGWAPAVHPDDFSNCLEQWERTIATECDYEVECRLKRASDGAYRWHLARAFPLRNQKGEIVNWVGTATDTEDQKQASHELERRVAERTAELTQAHEKLQSVLDGATNVAIIATNVDGIITLFNTGAENLLGYTSDELVGRQTPGIFHLASEIAARELELSQELGKPAQGFDVFAQKAQNGSHEEHDWTYVRKDGSHLTVNLVITALETALGPITGFLGVAMDVSARKKAEAASRASEEHFRLIVESVEDYALIMLDAGGHVISWNTGAERIKGYTAAEIIGQHFSIFYTPEDIEKRRPDEDLQVAAKLGRYTEEAWRVRKDGSRFVAQIGIAPIHDEAGKVRGFAKVIHDVTERKRTEERFQLVVEASPSALIMVKHDGLITLVNSQTEKLFGYGRHELVGRPVEMLLPERFRGPHGALVANFFSAPSARAMATGRELYGLRKDGSEIPVEIGLKPIDASTGKFVLASVIDITERKVAEIALRESDVKFRTMVEAVPQMVWITRADGFNTYFSQRWMDYTGLTLEESLGHGWIKPFHPEDQQRAWEAWQQAINTIDGSYRLECRLRRADGAYRWFLILGVRQLDSAGTTLKWFGTCTDITLAKLSEGELKAANEELEKFAYVASHDLKAPLRAIQNSAKWLEEDLADHLTDETRQYLNVLQGRVKRMERLLDDLLEYARIGRATDNRYSETIKGDLLVEDVLALLSLENFTVEVGPGFANIDVCRMPLQHILMNLISNGIKHHHKKTGNITVTVEDDGDFFVFAVKDDGPGIGAQFHDQIFEMFRTLRPRDQVEGSGMGLAMVRKHIEICGGTLRLESTLGEGSTFRFTWPRRQKVRKELE